MKATGAGALVTASRGIDVPTQPMTRPADWPARPQRAAWTSPIRPANTPTSSTPTATARRATTPRSSTTPSSSTTPRPQRPQTTRTSPTRTTPTPATVLSSSGSSAAGAVGASSELVAELRARWAAGEPQVVIAAALGISVTRLQRLRRAHGIARRRRPVDAAEAVRLYVDEQLGLEDVAARLGTVSAAIRYQLRKAGVTTRPMGTHGRPAHVRDEALARIAAGERPIDVRRALGIGESTLLRWRRTHTTTTTTTTRSSGSGVVSAGDV